MIPNTLRITDSLLAWWQAWHSHFVAVAETVFSSPQA